MDSPLMGLREKLRKNPYPILIGLFILVCVVVILTEFTGQHRPTAAFLGKGFYSDDDGATWFIDDVSKGSPFDHNGKPAYRALVYRCGGGKPFVAFLAKYSDRQKAQMDAEAAQAPAGTPSRVIGEAMKDLKTPGVPKWWTNTTATLTGYPRVVCPDASASPQAVVPSDPGSGATN
jgi:hypothetical protein